MIKYKILLAICIIMLLIIRIIPTEITYMKTEPFSEIQTTQTGSNITSNTQPSILTTMHTTTATQSTTTTAKSANTTTKKKTTTSSTTTTTSKTAKKPKYIKPNGNWYHLCRETYTEEEFNILSTLISHIEMPEKREEKIIVDHEVSYHSYYRIASFFYIYFGEKQTVDLTFDVFNQKDKNGKEFAEFKVRDDADEWVKNQNKFKDYIDKILKSFEDGSEEYILKQISDFIMSHIVYDEKVPDIYSAIATERGSCNAYALLFNAMANRAGIQSDMCIGKTNKGVYHAWNRVTLQDGTYRYYDITFQDTSNSKNYLHLKESPHTTFLINDYTKCWDIE